MVLVGLIALSSETSSNQRESGMAITEIVHIRPKPESINRLKEIRPAIIKSYQARYPNVKAELYEVDDGTWVDIWTWSSRAEADEALADTSISPEFGEWQTHVELLSLKWAKLVTTF